MAVKKIRKIGDPVLREKSKPVEKIDKSLMNTVKDMIDTVRDGDVAGIGLAAPQIGISKRLIVVNIGEIFEAFINPEIHILDKTAEEEEEGCLSIYSEKTTIPRPKKILFKALDLKNQPVEIEAEGIVARILMHEVDHLEGILFIDYLNPSERKTFLTKISRDNIL